MRAERVRHIMTAEVVSIELQEPVTELIRTFADNPLHHLPVVERGEIRGMVSSADMLKLENFIPKSGAISAVFLNDRFKIKTLMREPVITAGLDDTIEDAVSRMVSHGVHALPVVNERNLLVGIVTTTDVMQAFLHGMGLRPSHDPTQAGRPLDEIGLRAAVDAAGQSVANGSDTHGVGAALLQLHERNQRLEQLRQNVSRYLRVGAEDPQLHSRLLKSIESLDDSVRPARLNL